MISKSYKYKDSRKYFYLCVVISSFLISACSSTKYIADDQAVVKKVVIDSVNAEFEEQAQSFIQTGIRPTTGLGLSNKLYNIFNVKNGVYKTANIKNIGTPPQLLDSLLVEVSRKQIEKFLKSKGYFNASVKDTIEVKNKIAHVKFTAKQGSPFTITKYDTEIQDTSFNTLYQVKIAPSIKLTTNIFDEDHLNKIREDIFTLSQKNGYYAFNRQYVKFEVDTNFNNQTATVKLLVENPTGKWKHPQYTLGHSNIVIAPNSDGFTDSITFNPVVKDDIRFTDLSGKFKDGPILRYDFLKNNRMYNIDNEALTYDRLYQLNTFKNVKISYTKSIDSTKHIINPLIEMIPYKRMSNRIEAEIPFNRDIYGLTLSNTYTNNNFLKGAERFDFQVSGGMYAHNDSKYSLMDNIYQRNFSVSASLRVPRLLSPFKIPLIAQNGVPHTTFSSSYLYSMQKDVLQRQIFINSITYDWVETKSKLHSLTPLYFEYRFGQLLLDENSIDKLLTSSSYNYALLSRQDVTLGIKYTYDLNSDKLLNNNKGFVYFRGTMESAGNLLAGIAKLGGQKFDPANGQYAKLLGLPFNQYIRPEVDIRWYKPIGKNTFILRFNGGVGYTYGNSKQLPFEKRFFGGGSIGVRAWQARTLGPGNYNRSIIKGETPAETELLRRSLIGVDQLGDMVLQGNLEYRFAVKSNFAGGNINGALFLDAGNIWDLSAKSQMFDTQNTIFRLNFRRLASQIALGTGFGLRYDVQYFVFRLDIGFKVKDPQFGGNDQWVIKHLFKGSKEFKNQYYVDHAPDRYRFVQYNFGIGLPF